MELTWIKAGSCNVEHCVEVAFTKSFVHVRDSNNPTKVLDFTYEEWRAFTEGAKLGEFDL
jgi:hypothetical protein